MQRLKVTEVNPGSCLDIGIQRGDYLDTYNEVPLDTSEALSAAMNKFAGQTHRLRYIRGFEILEHYILAGRLGINVESGEVDEELLLLVQTMPMSTTPFIPGATLIKTVDIVSSECVFGVSILKDLLTAISDVFGGRSGTAQNALRDAKKICLTEMRIDAAKAGANAIVGINFNYNEISGQNKSMLFLVVTGTAVLMEQDTK